MHLIDILMRKTKSSQILYLCLFFFFPRLLSIYISMFLCKFHTQFKKKTREMQRESFQSLFLNEKLYYGSFLFFSFFARIFSLHYISIVILYFFYLYFWCLCFFILFWSLIYIFFFLLFFNFLFFYFLFYINQFWKKTRERVSIHCFSMKNYTIVILFSFFFFPYNNYFQFSSQCFSMKNYIIVFVFPFFARIVIFIFSFLFFFSLYFQCLCSSIFLF
jgi:hypothetical protein